MQKRTLIITTLLAVVLLPGSSVLAQALQLNGNAVCEGWTATATLTFPAGVFSADLDYSVVLTDQSGAEVTRFDHSGTESRMEDSVIIKMYGEPWGLTLDSVYTASIVFRFLGEEAAMSFDIVCGEVGGGDDGVDPGEDDTALDPCHQNYRYWRRNPDQWPVSELEIAGQTFSQDQLLRMMNRNLRLHPAFNLLRHLVAAKLNVAAGCDPSIQATIDAADDFIAERAGNPRQWWRSRGEARQLQQSLFAYNTLPCDGFASDGGQDSFLNDKAYADEPVSFSGLKAMYR
jgi:hypothetical protein